jgi:hyperosmotically inducible protein
MTVNRLYAGIIAAGLFLGVAAGATAQQPDNTKITARDREASQRTADQAKNNMSDRQIMQKIRKSVMADKSISTYGHNAKIISEHGKVTLKGPVHTEEERRNIEAKATEVAGAGNVDNQISVKHDK